MILPIIALGDPVLRQKAVNITSDYENLSTLIANMFETMYSARGIGLAAPQIGLPIRLFIVDSMQILNDENKENSEIGIKKVFINANIIERGGKKWSYNEGCLSIPSVREDINRLETLRIQYVDENFNLQEEFYAGINARVIMHEYDHIEGILFIDYLSQLKKGLLQRKFDRIMRGDVDIDYRMKFPLKKGR